MKFTWLFGILAITSCSTAPTKSHNALSATVQDSCSAIFKSDIASVVHGQTLFIIQFDRPVDLVYSINGDPLVLEPATVTGVIPNVQMVGGKITNGRMKNPPVTPLTSKQAYDERTPYSFDRSLLANLPVSIGPGDSLVLASSETPSGSFAFDGSPKISFIESAAVLTGWNREDVCNSYVIGPHRVTLFRPAFAGVKKSFDGIHFRFDKLPRLIHIPNPPDVNLFMGGSPKLNLTSSSWAGEYWSPNDLGENYQAYLGRLWGERLLLAISDNVTWQQKIDLLITAVQNAIDIAGVADAGGSWSGEDGGGHQIGFLSQVRFLGHFFDVQAFEHPSLNDGKYTEHNGQFYLSNRGFFYNPIQTSLWRMNSQGGIANILERDASLWDANDKHSMNYISCCTITQSFPGWLALSIMGIFDPLNDPADAQLRSFTRFWFSPLNPQFQAAMRANSYSIDDWGTVSGVANQLLPAYGNVFR